MEYRTLGRSDIKVFELAFGAWFTGDWLRGGADSKDAIKAIETAVDEMSRINFLLSDLNVETKT